MTGTAIARGLLDYAQALTASAGSASILVPTLRTDGSRGVSQFLIGPASQLLSDTEDGSSEEIIDEELIASMKYEVGLLRSEPRMSSTMVPADSAPHSAWEFDSWG